MAMSKDYALEMVSEISDMIEEEITENQYDKASDFFDSVLEGAKEVGEKIENTERVSDAQAKALRNWKASIEKWLD